MPRGFGGVKRIENVCEMLGIDARTAVADGEADPLATFPPSLQNHPPALGGKLDRVGNKIGQDELQFLRICLHERQIPVQIRHHIMFLTLGKLGQVRHYRRDHLVDRNIGDLQLGFSGLNVAQAQHVLQEMATILMDRGVKVRYAIHPVAGRMPGHMNVLLAEANVPYDKLYDMADINSEFSRADVAFILGANDVVNPGARNDRNSPIYGMPILDVDKSRTVIVIKRSLSPGFAGIPNQLFINDNSLMLFGDAKAVLQDLTKAVNEL